MSVTVASNTEPLEREAERARMRLAGSLERLANPAVQEAVKQQITGYGMRLKDQALQYVQETKDDILEKGRETGRQKVGGFVDDLKRKASENPLGVALIGAGIAWRLYKKPPITTLLVGAGVATLMRSGHSSDEDRRNYRDPYREDQPRGYVPGGVAGYGYPEESPGLAGTVARQLGGLASQVGDKARHAAADVSEQARGVASGLAERASDAVEQVRHAADEVSDRASDVASHLVDTARGLKEKAVHAVHDATGQVSSSGMGGSPDYADREDFVGSWEHGGAVDTFAGHRGSEGSLWRPVALGVAGLVAGIATYGYLRSTPR